MKGRPDLSKVEQLLPWRSKSEEVPPAAFLDRDGVINVDRGFTYLGADLVFTSLWVVVTAAASRQYAFTRVLLGLICNWCVGNIKRREATKVYPWPRFKL